MKVIYFDISHQTSNVCTKINQYGFNLNFTNQPLDKNSMFLCNDMDVVVLLTPNYEFDAIILNSLQAMGVRLIIVTENTKKNLDFNLLNNQLKIKVAQVDHNNNALFNFSVLNSVLNLLFAKNSDSLVQQNILQKNITLIGDNKVTDFLSQMLKAIGFQNIFYFNKISENISTNNQNQYVTWEKLTRDSDLISIQDNCFETWEWINQKWIATLKPNVTVINNVGVALHHWDSIKSYFLFNSNFRYGCNFIDASNGQDYYDLKNVVLLNPNQFFLNLIPEFLNLVDFKKCIQKINEIIFIFGTTARTKAIIDK